ncbi:MAG: DUF262 domain-containing protein [Alphaproteobacteria bacterium]
MTFLFIIDSSYAMKVNHIRFINFLGDGNMILHVPVYQRHYSWTTQQCRQLFNDICSIEKKLNDKPHFEYFLGAIVLNPHRDEKEDHSLKAFMIIDGQQRITTIILLLLAICKIIDEMPSKELNQIKERILNDYVNVKYAPIGKKVKLKFSNDDDAILEKIINKQDDDIKVSSNIINNFRFFEKEIKKQEIDISKICWRVLEALRVIHIELDDIDNPHLIFEGLNSTGLDLDKGDLIRNFLLMNIKPEDQIDIHNKYWVKIETNAKCHGLTNFFRHYLQAKGFSNPAIAKLYHTFQEFKEEFTKDKTIEELFKDIMDWSYLYNEFITMGSFKDINEKLYWFHNLDFTVSYAFLLYIFSLRKEKYLNDDQVSEIIQYLEMFFVRRATCGIQSTGLDKRLYQLIKYLKNLINENVGSNKFLDSFKYELLPNDKHISDEDIKRNLSEDIYNKQISRHILAKLEGNHKESPNILEKINSTSKKHRYEVEHIMPQTLSPEWKKYLGANYENIYNNNCHSLGNLTLTAYNKELSNKPFDKKKAIFVDSNLGLNEYFKNITNWGENEIKERTEILYKKFLELYPLPLLNNMSAHIPETHIDNEYNIDNLNDDFAGLKPDYLMVKKIKDKKIYITSWKDFYWYALDTMYNDSPNTFKEVVETYSPFFFPTEDNVSNYDKHLYHKNKIGKYYIHTNLSSSQITKRINKFCDSFKLYSDDLVFGLETG